VAGDRQGLQVDGGHGLALLIRHECIATIASRSTCSTGDSEGNRQQGSASDHDPSVLY
jgi:hypothetical protein